MGVPGLYRNLLKLNRIAKNLNSNKYPTQYLYIDANNVIHKAKESILNSGNLSNIDSRIISDTISRLKTIIMTVNPSVRIMISIDGVPPYAKAIQQHNRRYRSEIEADYIQELASKYNQNIPKWDSSKISPGTEFMNQLQESIRLSISDIKSKGIELVFSTYHNPGEGNLKSWKI